MSVFSIGELNPLSNAQAQGALCSRICHDLISPLGAVKNGLELWGDNGDIAQEIYSLLFSSSSQALDRLNIYRHAFGINGSKIIGSFDRFLPLFEAACRLFNWRGKLQHDSLEAGFSEGQAAQTYYCILLMILVAGDLMPLGGDIQITCEKGVLSFFGRGRLFPVKPEYLAILNGTYTPEDVVPTNVFAHYLRDYCQGHDQVMFLTHRLPDELCLVVSQSQALALTGSLF